MSVNVVATVEEEDGKILAEWRTSVAPKEPEELILDFTPMEQRPVKVELTVHASRPLQAGERAVIDISPLVVYPVTTALATGATSEPTARITPQKIIVPVVA